MKIHTVVVCDDKWGIARSGALPFGLTKEKEFFFKILADTRYLPPGRRNVCIMGRKSWSHGDQPDMVHLRSHTYNFLLSRTLKEKPHGVNGIVSNIDEFVALMESPEWKDKIGRVFNVGGGGACEHIHPTKHCGRAYMSRVKGDFDCDTFCPNLDEDKTFKRVEKVYPFEEIIPDGNQVEEDGKEWVVNIYEKINNA